VTSTTVFSKPQSATAAALKVGLCVTATGSTDTTGALTATALSLRTADATGCTTRRRAQPSSGTNG
jgi:hypothetical protein